METDALSGSVESRAVVRRSTCDVRGRFGGRAWEFGREGVLEGQLAFGMRVRDERGREIVVPFSAYFSALFMQLLYASSFAFLTCKLR